MGNYVSNFLGSKSGEDDHYSIYTFRFGKDKFFEINSKTDFLVLQNKLNELCGLFAKEQELVVCMWIQCYNSKDEKIEYKPSLKNDKAVIDHFSRFAPKSDEVEESTEPCGVVCDVFLIFTATDISQIKTTNDYYSTHFERVFLHFADREYVKFKKVILNGFEILKQ